MKKAVLLAVFAVTCFAGTSSAQHSKIGVEAGFTLSDIHYHTFTADFTDPTTPTIKEEKAHADYRAAVRGGFTFDLPMGDRYSLVLGLQYAMKGYKMDERYTSQDVDYINKANYKLHYAEVPISLAVRMGGVQINRRSFEYIPVTQFVFYIGPYFGYAFAGTGETDSTAVGNNKLTEDHVTKDLTFGTTAPTLDVNNRPKAGDDFNNIDYGVQVGVGVDFPFGLYTRVQYQQGLNNLSNGFIDYGTLKPTAGFTKNFGMSVMVGYWLKR